MTRIPLVASCLCVLTLVQCGCQGNSGPQRIAVQGIVEHKAQPLVNGTITILPDKAHKGPAVNGTIQKGKFYIPASEGPVPGPHIVQVNLTPVKMGSDNMSGKPAESVAPRLNWEFHMEISKDKPELDLVLDDKK